jgi:hypothetical protein
LDVVRRFACGSRLVLGLFSKTCCCVLDCVRSLTDLLLFPGLGFFPKDLLPLVRFLLQILISGIASERCLSWPLGSVTTGLDAVDFALILDCAPSSDFWQLPSRVLPNYDSNPL